MADGRNVLHIKCFWFVCNATVETFLRRIADNITNGPLNKNRFSCTLVCPTLHFPPVQETRLLSTSVKQKRGTFHMQLSWLSVNRNIKNKCKHRFYFDAEAVLCSGTPFFLLHKRNNLRQNGERSMQTSMGKYKTAELQVEAAAGGGGGGGLWLSLL